MNKEASLIPTAEELNVYQVMAKKATDSQLFNKIGGEAGLLSIMLMARELGLPAFQAIMGGMNVIQGKVELSPRLMNSMIRKAGHKIEIVESTDQICKLKGIRHDTQECYVATFSIDDAKRAGLVRSGGGWEKYPSDMLFARCISKLARRLFADVISTAYVSGEILDQDRNPDLRGEISESEELAEVVQKSTIVVEEGPRMTEVEIMQETKELTLSEFIESIRGKVGDKYSLIAMNHYLEHLEESKKVPQVKIMEQALNPLLMERFCRGWKSWYDSYSESQAEVLDKM